MFKRKGGGGVKGLLNNVKKTALFLHGGLPKCALKMQLLILLAHQKFDSLCPSHTGSQKKLKIAFWGLKQLLPAWK